LHRGRQGLCHQEHLIFPFAGDSLTLSTLPTNRRRFPRLILEAEVDLQSDHNFFAGLARDISLGGLFIETELPLGVGARVEVMLTMGAQKVSLACEVAWTLFDDADHPVGLGLHFLALSPQTLAHITDFMRSRAPIDFEQERHPPRRGAGPPPLPGARPTAKSSK
jgi:uncharacterized protein (TIGR02266 family)